MLLALHPRFALRLTLLVSLGGCEPWAAKVNGEKIPVALVEERQHERIMDLRASGYGDRIPGTPDLTRVILEQLIDETLLLREADKRGIEVSESELSAGLGRRPPLETTACGTRIPPAPPPKAVQVTDFLGTVAWQEAPVLLDDPRTEHPSPPDWMGPAQAKVWVERKLRLEKVVVAIGCSPPVVTPKPSESSPEALRESVLELHRLEAQQISEKASAWLKDARARAEIDLQR